MSILRSTAITIGIASVVVVICTAVRQYDKAAHARAEKADLEKFQSYGTNLTELLQIYRDVMEQQRRQISVYQLRLRETFMVLESTNELRRLRPELLADGFTAAVRIGTNLQPFSFKTNGGWYASDWNGRRL